MKRIRRSRAPQLQTRLHYCALLLLFMCSLVASAWQLTFTRTASATYSTPTRIQFKSSKGTSLLSVTLDAIPTDGNRLIAVLGTQGGINVAISGISQTGTTWTLAKKSASSSTNNEIWYSGPVSGGGTGITVSFSGVPTSSSIVVAEYSGLASSSVVDQTASANGFTSPASTGTTAATTQTHELWVGGFTVQNGSTFGAPTNSFAKVAETGATAGNTSFIERIVTATGTASSTSTYTGTFQTNVGNMATFKARNPDIENILLTQSGYRIFNNSNGNDVGFPLSTLNNPSTLTSTGQAFRIRNLIHAANGQIDPGAMSFKLEFVDPGTGTCTAPAGGTPASYTPITGDASNWTLKSTQSFLGGNSGGRQVAAFNGYLWFMPPGTNSIYYSSDGITWSSYGNIPFALRQSGKMLVFDDKLWIMGGVSGVSTYKNDVWYSTDGSTWTQATAAAGWSPRAYFGATVHDNKMWVMGGETGSSSSVNDVWYSSDGATWAQATSSADWSARLGIETVTLNGTMYMVGGKTSPSTYYNQTWSSTDGVSWTQEAAPGWSARAKFGATVMNGKIWVAGGEFGTNTNQKTNDVWYSSDGNSWTQVTSAANWGTRMNIGLVSYGGNLWAMGGDTGTGTTSGEVWSADTASVITWNKNGSASSGTTLTPNVNDPTHAGDTVIDQSYVDTGLITTTATITSGEDGLWDFSLIDNGAPEGKTYCFRVVKDSGSPLDTYSVYPTITTFAPSSNTAPSSPSSLSQAKVSSGTTVNTGGWTNDNQITLLASASDPDPSDTLQLCVENQPLSTSFTDSGEVCGAAISYTGTPVTTSVTLTSLPENEYHWQARIKDGAGAYSGWVSYGANLESARDFGVDTTAPTGTVYDGLVTGVDAMFNSGSLTSLSANWNINAAISGIAGYEYSVGTSAGATDVLGWTNASTSTSATASPVTLTTSKVYFFNVRAIDNAGNTGVISSNGQMMAPILTFAASSNLIDFATPSAANSYTVSQNVTLTITTNAQNGYKVSGKATDFLKNQQLQVLGMFHGGTYAAPAAWGSGTGFGYTSSDTSVAGVNRFNSPTCPGGGSAPCFAPYATTGLGDVIADGNGPVTGDAYTITNKVSINATTQQAGKYQTTVLYSAYATY